MQQIAAPDGSVVNQFVSPSGIVFGVSWQGATIPDLSQLLGEYFPEFQQAARSLGRKRGGIGVKTDRVVVESGGHMRAFRGRAYVPALVPESLSPAVIQ